MNTNFWQKYKKIIIIFLIWWMAINFFAFLSANRFNLEPDTAYTWISVQWWPESSNSFLNLHARWDSWFYIDIAENGYSCAEGELCNSVFFPLYPLLIRIFSFLPGINYYLAGFLISNLCIFGAVIVFYKLLLLKYSRQIAEKAVWFLLIFPTSFFFTNIYTESLFLLLSLSCFYFIFKEKWKMAGIMGLLASFTRVTGFLLFFPMLWEFFRKEKKKYKEIPWLILPLLGPLIFFSYHWKKFGDFFLFFKVEKLWGREILSLNGDHLDLLTNPAKINLFLDLFILLFVLVSIIFVWKKIRRSYAVYMGLSLFVPLSTGTLMSSNRYVLVLFPIYILMAVWADKKPEFEKIYTIISVLLLALYIILFVNNYWAG
jgi:hypothetical protein